MFEIKEILRLEWSRNMFNYVGSICYGQKFDIGDNVFFQYNYDGVALARGIICGVELLPDNENPKYRYKIEIPKEIGERVWERRTGSFEGDKLFTSLEEAKGSVLEHLEYHHERQTKEVMDYFKQFEKK